MAKQLGLAMIAAAALLAGLSAQEVFNAPAVPQGDYTDAWPGFVVAPWSFKTPPLNEATARAYREQGVNGIHVDKLITDAQAEWLARHRFSFFLDHAAGKGYLYLRDQQAIKGLKASTQAEAGLIRRPNCLHDEKVIAAMAELVRRQVSAAARHKAVFYSLDDEISTGSFVDPVETCWCPSCQPAFRKFALGLHGGSLERLNGAWGTAFKTVEEISPASAGYAVRQAATLPPDRWNFARWADFHQFMDQTMMDALVRLVKLSNEIDPKRPCGFEGGQQPSAYGGYDYSRLARALQWIEAYDIGSNNEIVRSLAPKVVRVKTFFSNQDKLQDSNRLWYHFVHGDRAVILWPAWGEEPWWNEKAELRPEVAHLPPIFREQTGERLAGLLAGAQFLDDGVAIYYSQPSIRAGWVLDATVHGDTWPNRSGGIDRYSGSAILGRYAWLAMLEDAQLQYRFIDAPMLSAGELTFPRYKALILPAVHALSDAEAKAIKAFAESGGTVIADYLPGIMDEHCRSRGSKGALDDLFGVKHDWSRGLFDGKHVTGIDGEKHKLPLEQRIIRDRVSRPNEWVLVEPGIPVPKVGPNGLIREDTLLSQSVRHGKGLAWWLNRSPVQHLLNRREGRDDSDAAEVLKGLSDAGVKPPFRVETAGRFNEVLRWRKGDRVVVCIVKNAQANLKDWGKLAPLAGMSDKPAELKVTLVGPSPAGPVVNERTGKKMDVAADKDGTHFTDTWVPCEAAIYSYPVKSAD